MCACSVCILNVFVLRVNRMIFFFKCAAHIITRYEIMIFPCELCDCDIKNVFSMCDCVCGMMERGFSPDMKM